MKKFVMIMFVFAMITVTGCGEAVCDHCDEPLPPETEENNAPAYMYDYAADGTRYLIRDTTRLEFRIAPEHRGNIERIEHTCRYSFNRAVDHETTAAEIDPDRDFPYTISLGICKGNTPITITPKPGKDVWYNVYRANERILLDGLEPME